MEILGDGVGTTGVGTDGMEILGDGIIGTLEVQELPLIMEEEVVLMALQMGRIIQVVDIQIEVE